MARRKKPTARLGVPSIGGPVSVGRIEDRARQPRNPGKYAGVFNPLPRGRTFGRFDARLPGRPAAPQIPLRPPPGTYDPVLDAQERAANRGLGQLESDTLLANTRDDIDKTYGLGEIARQQGEGLSDLTRDTGRQMVGFGEQRADTVQGRDRGLADLMTSRTRGTEDYGTGKARLGEDYARSTQGLQRQFTQLGNQQAQGARAAGVAQGGALAQAMRKRAANQAWEQQGLDTAHSRGSQDLDSANSRFMDDNTSSVDRLQQDAGTALSRLGTRESWLGEDTATASQRMTDAGARASGQLVQGFERAGTDRQTGLDRARIENTQFGRDIGRSRWYESRGLYTPPQGTEVAGWGRPRPVRNRRRRG